MVMKTILKKSASILVTTLTSLSLFCACQKNDIQSLQGYQNKKIHTSDLQTSFVSTPQLTSAETASLVLMKEEEKLARDVYSALYKKWGSNIFSNIQASENNHMSEVISLIKYYNIADSLILTDGKFNNTDLQSLYNQLVAKGSASVSDAFTVGALIEDLDIKDLTELISKTANLNIINVFTQIRSGSYNHINSFVSQLSSLGITYKPSYITQEEFDSIIKTGSSGRGNGRNKNHN